MDTSCLLAQEEFKVGLDDFNLKNQQGDVESRAETLGLLLGYKLGLDYPSWVTWMMGCDVEGLESSSDSRNISEDESQQSMLQPDFLEVSHLLCSESVLGHTQVISEA